MRPPITPRRSAYTLIETLLVLALATMLISLLLPAVQRARELTYRTQCTNNLKQFGLGIYTYHDVYGALLPSHLEDPTTYSNPSGPSNTGQATWAVLITPYIDNAPFYNLWDITKPYNSQTINFRQTPQPLYYCPARRVALNQYSIPGGSSPQDQIPGGLSDYAVAGGNDGTVPGIWYTGQSQGALVAANCASGLTGYQSRTKFTSVSDGLSCTIFLGEKHLLMDSFGAWPVDNSIFNGASPYNHIRVGGPGYEIARNIADTANAQTIFGSYHTDFTNFLMGDGSVQSIQDNVSGTILGNLVLRNDGNVIPDWNDF